jgi:hypothetical protein
MGMAAVRMEQRKQALARIIGRARAIYCSARQKQFNLEHVRVERVGLEQSNFLSLSTIWIEGHRELPLQRAEVVGSDSDILLDIMKKLKFDLLFDNGLTSLLISDVLFL